MRIAAKAVVRMYQECATRLAAAGERGSSLASPWRVDLGWFVREAGLFRDAEAGPPRHRNIEPFLRPGGVGGGDRWAGAMAATESGGIPAGPRGPWCSRSRAEDRRALRSDPWRSRLLQASRGSGRDIARVVRSYRFRLPPVRQLRTSILLRSGKTHHVMA